MGVCSGTLFKVQKIKENFDLNSLKISIFSEAVKIAENWRKKLFCFFLLEKKYIILLGTVIPDKTSSSKSKLDQNQSI